MLDQRLPSAKPRGQIDRALQKSGLPRVSGKMSETKKWNCAMTPVPEVRVVGTSASMPSWKVSPI
jgi:hypothetical protein